MQQAVTNEAWRLVLTLEKQWARKGEDRSSWCDCLRCDSCLWWDYIMLWYYETVCSGLWFFASFAAENKWAKKARPGCLIKTYLYIYSWFQLSTLGLTSTPSTFQCARWNERHATLLSRAQSKNLTASRSCHGRHGWEHQEKTRTQSHSFII